MSQIFIPSDWELGAQANPLESFATVSLAESRSVELLDRADTKFVFHTSQLTKVLQALQADYSVLEIDGARIGTYRTVYFDTTDFRLYLQHHSGKPGQLKVRSRHYLESERSFLEVKSKFKVSRTQKKRIETNVFVTSVAGDMPEWQALELGPFVNELEPKLWSQYNRITLIGKRKPERVTLDLNLQMTCGQRTTALPRIVIAELKQERQTHNSVMRRVMHSFGVPPIKLSKYCTGIALLNPQLKHNHFKPILQRLEQLGQTDAHE